ncbi:hypothetical protein DES53_11462 [Roseimicrobium gellanilyticum]|uniref:Concanavalin A-like lectin/glucanase superfamily protein n=2 Tax=Roseimicrobium gellanilyticum TaxID=748857 RepID=A0A366H8G4_9BACT|nr:hypothetical protein DES53_11462 [Roseimicrobium gellanilyticum]
MASLSLLPSCDKDGDDGKETKSKSSKEKSSSKDKSKSKSDKSHPPDDNPTETSQAIEAFTGAHTRLVWAKASQPHEGDTFAQSDKLLLMGIDTRDGKGERAILSKPANYSRPLLSTTGEVILYTDKNTVRKGGKKHYHPVIYRTDWKGSAPVKLAEGYAVDCWKDPASGTEYVFAVSNLKATKGLSLEGDKLIRFPLEDPSKVEVMYDDTPITPDNVQFSRDGTRASGQFPWPHSGVLILQGGKYTAKKITTGCWSGLAPDNSGVGWTFDGEHRKVAMAAEDGSKNWYINLSEAAGMKGSELYHPRWSNHARYIVITGPYAKKKGEDGSVINKGGGSAEIYLGRMSETADKMEAWLQICHDNRGDAYPDAWIANADSANLKGYTIPTATQSGASVIASSWPASKEGLLFFWKDRTTLNAFATRDGAKHESVLAGRDAARYGRMGELLLDGGSYEAEPEFVKAAVTHLRTQPAATFEALVLPGQYEGTAANAPLTTIFNGADFTVGEDTGHLVLVRGATAWRSKTALPAVPYHLAVTRSAEGFAAQVNGEPLELDSLPGGGAKPGPETLTFGGGWNGGLLQVALYDRILTDEEIASNAHAAQARVSTFPSAPQRVKLSGKLTESSPMPTPEGISPYTGALVAHLYEVEKIHQGTLETKTVLVKHWAMLGEKVVQGFPREVGKTYELLIEREVDHTQLKGERVIDDTTAFDQEAWFDVASPRVAP